MFHQFSTWWRALSVVLLGLATLTWPSAASAVVTPSFSVISQGAVANMSAAGASSFHLDLSAPAVTTTSVTLDLYSPLVYRSQVADIIAGQGATTSSIAATGVTSPTCRTGTTLSLTVSVFSANGTGPSHQCGNQPLHLRLPCATSACDGVYPLAIRVTVNNVAHVEWSLLAVHVTPVTQPLKVSYVFVVDPSSWANPALAEANFATLARFASVPITLAVDYRPLADAILSTSRQKWKASLTSALKSTQHRAIVAPSPLIDMAGLAANGFAGEVTRQVTLGNHLLQTITGRGTDGPVFVSSPTSPAALIALAHAGVSDVIVPDDSLTVAPSNTLTWGAPFAVTDVNGVTALATDSGLAQLTSDSAIEPGRRAALTLATLAFLHFEAPNASAARTVVVPINVGTTSPTYLNDLLATTQSNPFVTPSTLTPSFSPSLIATNASPTDRTLAPTGQSVWSPNNVNTLRSLIQRTESFINSIQSSSEPIALQTNVALAEQTGGPAAREGVLRSATSSLNAQLQGFRIDNSTITLTGSSTVLPITIFSSAHYPVILLLHLSTDRLSFPQGDPVAVALNTATTPLRIPAIDRVAGGLTLQLELTTKDGSLVLAQAPVQVRVAGNSVVGYLLSGASLLVLSWWWLRTYRRKSRGRHSR